MTIERKPKLLIIEDGIVGDVYKIFAEMKGFEGVVLRTMDEATSYIEQEDHSATAAALVDGNLAGGSDGKDGFEIAQLLQAVAGHVTLIGNSGLDGGLLDELNLPYNVKKDNQGIQRALDEVLQKWHQHTEPSQP